MNKGWFCFHRAHLDLPIGSSLELVGAWAIFQSAASHELREFFFGIQKIRLERGQFLWGELKFGARMNCSPSKARRILKIFEAEGLILTEAKSKFSIVTIRNYDVLQSVPTKSEEQKKSKKSSAEEQKKTYNNLNNFKQFKPGGVDLKTFSLFFKWVRDMPGHIRQPEKYAKKIFEKYPENIIRLALRDETTVSLKKFNESIEMYLARERKRADNSRNT